MSIDAEVIPIHSKGRGRTVPIVAVGMLAALLVSGCSAKNPDALTGSNLDENLAIMNGPANLETSAPSANVSEAQASSPSSSDRSAVVPKRQASDARVARNSELPQQSADNTATTDNDEAAAPDDSADNQVGNDTQTPNNG